MSDFRVRVTIRSERILSRIEERFGSQSEMAKAIGWSPQMISAFVCMRRSPLLESGDFSDGARDFAAALGAYPEEIWPEHMARLKRKKADFERSMSIGEVAAIMGHQPDQVLLIEKLRETLNAREQAAIDAFMAGETLDNAAEAIGCQSRARARQITQKALRKMRVAAARRLGVSDKEAAVTLGGMT